MHLNAAVEKILYEHVVHDDQKETAAKMERICQRICAGPWGTVTGGVINNKLKRSDFG